MRWFCTGLLALTPSPSAPEGLPPMRGNGGPGRTRALLVLLVLVLLLGVLARRRVDGETEETRRLGRWEVTARLLEWTGELPRVGNYRYTFVMPYEVLAVHRSPPPSSVEPGDQIYVGHFQPHLSRREAAHFEADLGEQLLGGTLTGFHPGEVHRMALESPLQKWSPVGIIDRCYPQRADRYWAIWTNSTNLGRSSR